MLNPPGLFNAGTGDDTPRSDSSRLRAIYQPTTVSRGIKKTNQLTLAGISGSTFCARGATSGSSRCGALPPSDVVRVDGTVVDGDENVDEDDGGSAGGGGTISTLFASDGGAGGGTGKELMDFEKKRCGQ